MTRVHLLAIGGSDAGISAALRAREVEPSWDVTVLVADDYPNFSICGLPYYLSGDVPDWHDLAHRTAADLDAAGIAVRTRTRATRLRPADHRVDVGTDDGRVESLTYDAVVVGTGAVSVGAGYIGLEMAEALTTRGIHVTQVEALPEVMPTFDAQLGALVRAELQAHGVEVLTATTVSSIERAGDVGSSLRVAARSTDGRGRTRDADVVLVVVGVRPDAALAEEAGAALGVKGAIQVDRRMATNLPDVYAAGDCVITQHRLLGQSWLPLGTTAHKQGRVAGENAVGGDRAFKGSLGTQVVKVFDLVAARTGLRDADVPGAERPWETATVSARADDHKAYYPGATPIDLRLTGDRVTGRLLGAQLVGRRGAEIAKRVDVFAAAIFNGMTVDALNDLDLSYTPPLGTPWDAAQLASQDWARTVMCGNSR